MLDWRRIDGSWFGNGFRIEQASPAVWRLEEVQHAQDGSVSVDTDPIAALPSLQACKYHAEMLHNDRELTATRQRLGLVSLGALSLAVLSGSPLVLIAAAVIGGASIVELTLTWFDGRVGSATDLVQ
jgi:hypothetical protein